MKGRPRTLPSVLLNYDFVGLANKGVNARVRIRLLGLAHLQEGKSYAEVSRWLIAVLQIMMALHKATVMLGTIS